MNINGINDSVQENELEVFAMMKLFVCVLMSKKEQMEEGKCAFCIFYKAYLAAAQIV
jgi:hypothetical protein